MSFGWNNIKVNLDATNYHKSVIIPKSAVPPPTVYDGFEESIGEPEYQIRDLRKNVNGTECMHIKEYGDHYKAHRDKIDPKYDPVGHLMVDSPEIPAGVAVAIISGCKAGKAYYNSVKDTSEHPTMESALVALAVGTGTGILTYFVIKHARESSEG